jgi:hypothetical protein
VKSAGGKLRATGTLKRMAKRPLPAPLDARPFDVSTGLAAGVSPKRLRARDLDASVWGVRASSAPSLVQTCRMFALRMPQRAFFSHSTAALLLGAPLPLEVERSPSVHISVPRGQRAPHARGIHGHSLDVAPEERTTVNGLPVTTGARTWCDLASVLTIGDLVAVGDYFIHWRLPHTSRNELARVGERYAGKRGNRMIVAGLPLLDDRAESRPESRLRVILVLAGIPTMRANHVLVDTETGKNVRTDLLSKDYRTVLEYQGDYHRTAAQWRKDMTRRARLEADGWAVMELNADDLEDPEELVARVRTLLRRQGWRD